VAIAANQLTAEVVREIIVASNSSAAALPASLSEQPQRVMRL
jgi:hypothetical protein